MSVFRSPANGGKRPNPDAVGKRRPRRGRAGPTKARSSDRRRRRAERSGAGLASAQTGPGEREAREDGANLDPFSGRRESELAHRPKACHRCVSPGNSRSMDRSGLVRKVSGPHAQVAVDGGVRNPAFYRRQFHKPIPRRFACSSGTVELLSLRDWKAPVSMSVALAVEPGVEVISVQEDVAKQAPSAAP